MKVITLSSKKYEKLESFNLSRDIISTEGNILEFMYRGNPKVIKSLFYQDGAIFANKLYTLEMLDMYRELLPNSFVIPDYLIAVNRKITGFTVPMIQGVNLSTILKNKRVDLRKQLFYLKKVGEILQEMKTIRSYTELKDFYLNDLHEANFLVQLDMKNLAVVDLDSSKIGSNYSNPARYLTPFSLLNYAKDKYLVNDSTTQFGYVSANEDSDLYCYNIMILNFLSGQNVGGYSIDKFYSFLNLLDDVGVHHELIDSFNKLLVPCRNENPYLLLDDIQYSTFYKIRSRCMKK